MVADVLVTLITVPAIALSQPLLSDDQDTSYYVRWSTASHITETLVPSIAGSVPSTAMGSKVFCGSRISGLGMVTVGLPERYEIAVRALSSTVRVAPSYQATAPRGRCRTPALEGLAGRPSVGASPRPLDNTNRARRAVHDHQDPQEALPGRTTRKARSHTRIFPRPGAPELPVRQRPFSCQ